MRARRAAGRRLRVRAAQRAWACAGWAAAVDHGAGGVGGESPSSLSLSLARACVLHFKLDERSEKCDTTASGHYQRKLLYSFMPTHPTS